MVELVGSADGLGDACAQMTIGSLPPVGAISHRALPGPDDGLVIRASERLLLIAPHGGVALRVAQDRALRSALGDPSAWAAAREGDSATRCDSSHATMMVRWPEARSLVEACALDTLGSVRGTLGAATLLKQRERWTQADAPRPHDTHDHALRHLLTPPVIAIVGPPNAGKSTLANALAGRAVSIVDPRAGTTRDHVGVCVDLLGLEVMVLDLPGERADGDDIEQAAHAIARDLVARASLVVHTRAPGQDHARVAHPAGTASLFALLQADRASASDPGEGEVVASAATGQGMASLARAMRDALVPVEALESRRPWRFHPLLRSVEPVAPADPAGPIQSPTIE